MSKNVNEKDDLSYQSPEFQYYCVKALVEEPGFLAGVYKILDNNKFSTDPLRSVVGIIKEFYKDNKMVPSWNDVLFKANSRNRDKDWQETVVELVKHCQQLPLQGIQTAKDELLAFCKWKSAIAMAKEFYYACENEFDPKAYAKLEKRAKELIELGKDGSDMTRFTDDFIDAVMMEGDEAVVPTYIPEIDEQLDGGNAKGEIGLFLAKTGAGKTTFSSIISFNAALNGHKVVQIYFEDKVLDLGRKHIAKLVGTYQKRLKKLSREEATKIRNGIDADARKSILENLIPIRMKNGDTTVEDIEAKLEELKNTIGFKPDMIVIDYFSCLKHSTNPIKDQNLAEERCMKKLEMLAGKYNVALWVMQQTNRQGADAESGPNPSNWQGSFRCVQPSSVFLEMTRTNEQMSENKADIIFHKTRHSKPDHPLKDITFNAGTLTIDCSQAGYDPFEYTETEEPQTNKGIYKFINNETK